MAAMARSCFCGCDRTVGLLGVRIVRLGERHDRALDAVRSVTEREAELRDDDGSADVDYATTVDANQRFIGRGETLRELLVAVAHGKDSLSRAARSEVRAWQRLALKFSGQPR